MTPQEAKEMQEIKSRAESNTHQIEELKASVHHLEDKQDTIYKMSENLSLMAQSLKNVEEDVSDVKQNQKELSNKVSTLENQPSRESLENIKKVKMAVITAICTAIGTGLLWACISILANK